MEEQKKTKSRTKRTAKPKMVQAPKAPVKRYAAIKRGMWHPFVKVRIPTGSPGVILGDPLDNWTVCQIEAGLIKEL